MQANVTRHFEDFSKKMGKTKSDLTTAEGKNIEV